MRSPVYWHPYLYHLAMRFLYGRFFEERYSAIADLIPLDSDVCEVCMGDAYLYWNYLAKKSVTYCGLDINEIFVSHAIEKGVNADIHNLVRDPVPVADYIIMQAGLYQFIPCHKEILGKLISSAGKRVIVSEPIVNLSDSRNWFIAMIARLSANPGTGHPTQRFSRESLLGVFNEFSEFSETHEIRGGRELIGVFEK
ncbi:MAG: hypothetical protein HYY40_14220 [Bacteroidetes bacterium]|nr:hypothetical protein [Bacteroidota bacterium]